MHKYTVSKNVYYNSIIKKVINQKKIFFQKIVKAQKSKITHTQSLFSTQKL